MLEAWRLPDAHDHTEVVHLFAGIDSHKDTLAACLVDPAGRSQAQASFPSTPAGHRRLAVWLDRHSLGTRVGVEGGANLGGGWPASCTTTAWTCARSSAR